MGKNSHSLDAAADKPLKSLRFILFLSTDNVLLSVARRKPEEVCRNARCAVAANGANATAEVYDV